MRRWLTLPTFQRAYRRARREVVQGAIHVLLHATGTATHTLVAVMQDPEQPATARVSAARTILQMVIHVLHKDDVEADIAELEHLANQNGHGDPA